MSTEQNREYKRTKGAKPQSTEILELTIGKSLAKEKIGDELIEKLEKEMTGAAIDMGILLPPVMIRVDESMEPFDYVFKIRGVSMFENEMKNSALLASPGSIALMVAREIRDNPTEVLTRDEMERMLEEISETQPVLVKDALEKGSLDLIHTVSSELIKEGVPLKDMTTVLETIIHMTQHTQSVSAMVEVARSRLSRVITKAFTSKEDGKIHLFVLDGKTEEKLLEMVSGNIDRYELRIDVEVLRELVEKTVQAIRGLGKKEGHGHVLVVPRELRKALADIYEKFEVNLPVIAQADLDSRADFEIGPKISINF